MGYSYGHGYGYTWRGKRRVTTSAAVGGAGLLVGEVNGFATDFTHPTDAERVAIKETFGPERLTNGAFDSDTVWSKGAGWTIGGGVATRTVAAASNLTQTIPALTIGSKYKLTYTVTLTAGSISPYLTDPTLPGPTRIVSGTYSDNYTANGAHTSITLQGNATFEGTIDNVSLKEVVSVGTTVITNYGLDGFYSNAGTSPKMVYDISGALVWSPHNMFLNSAAPVSQSISTVVGQNYTVTVTGSGTITGSAGASGVATGGSPLTFTATATTSTFTKAGTVTQVQMNRGTVATAYIATLGTARYGLAVDYDPVTHVCKGLLCEPLVANLLLNSTTLSTQSVTVTAVAHVLSFWGTGTVTLTGTSTAGPLVGTGANNRVSLAFTPTAGSLTLTVSGTVTRAQLEIGSAGATSWIPTFAATATRAADGYSFLLNTIPTLGSEFSIYERFSSSNTASNRYPIVVSDGTTNELAGFRLISGVRMDVTDGSVVQATTTIGPALTANALTSVACRFKLNDCAMSVSGGAVSADTSVTMPTVTMTSFGGAGSTPVNALAQFYITKNIIVPRAWSDAELPVKSAIT